MYGYGFQFRARHALGCAVVSLTVLMWLVSGWGLTAKLGVTALACCALAAALINSRARSEPEH